ncbi:hypothetical protein DFH27DRAFT_583548 [Peziza echinospora]|nr:hypothetical protein DFH27DRAFT_583548 [Peziza echinospora]
MKKRTEEFRTYMDTKGYRFPMYFNVPIKGIGVWDTVGSLGIPVKKKGGVVRRFMNKWKEEYNRKYEFHNAALGLGVNNAFHAVALDEQRYAFRPTLWCWAFNPDAIPEELYNPLSGEHLRNRALCRYAPMATLYQMWFPGVHIDIGGGTDKGMYPEFSALTLMWMMRKFGEGTRPLLGFKEGAFEQVIHDSEHREKRTVKKTMWQRLTGLVTEPFHNYWVGSAEPDCNKVAPATTENTPLLRGPLGRGGDHGPTVDQRTRHREEDPCPDPAGADKPDRFLTWADAPISSNAHTITALSGMTARTPGVWTEFDHPCRGCAEASDQDPVTVGEASKREFIHAVVRLRHKYVKKLPGSLKGWEYDGLSAWVLKNEKGDVIASIPEYLPNGPEARLITGAREDDVKGSAENLLSELLKYEPPEEVVEEMAAEERAKLERFKTFAKKYIPGM